MSGLPYSNTLGMPLTETTNTALTYFHFPPDSTRYFKAIDLKKKKSSTKSAKTVALINSLSFRRRCLSRRFDNSFNILELVACRYQAPVSISNFCIL